MIKKITFIIFTIFISVSTFADNPNIPTKLYYGHNELYKKPNYAYNPHILKSKYDYSDVTLSITQGCNSDYERICAIYKWICDNISYDTEYETYDADHCFDKRKGVCQAYCNLFYYMAESIDIRVEIINGITKDFDGNISDGHGWIFAYTKKNYGILLDPTWGAGSVNGNEFTKSNDCWMWFNVSPEWMILSHFPENKSYQLIDNPISYNKFLSLTPSNSLWISYGMNDKDIYDMIMNDKLTLPTFYAGGEGKFKFKELPLRKSLKIGHTYTLRIKMITDNMIGIANGNSVIYKNDKWEHEGNNIYYIEFTPRKEGTLTFCIHDHDDVWSNMISYTIDTPTDKDWDMLKQHYPLDIPLVRDVKNLYEKEWENAGIDNHKLLQLIEKHNVKELPLFYTNMGINFKIISIPMSKKLYIGQSYTFILSPRDNNNLAIVHNDNWYMEWNTTNDGFYTMTITPKQKGSLTIYLQQGESNQYSGCISYDVE